jgi:hypothetical protein
VIDVPRYERAAAEWADELETQRSVEWSDEPPSIDGRDALRARAPRPGRDGAGRVHPIVDCWPGQDIF